MVAGLGASPVRGFGVSKNALWDNGAGCAIMIETPSTRKHLSRKKGTRMESIGSLACTGDSPLPFIIGGVVVLALAVLVVAFVVMRRK